MGTVLHVPIEERIKLAGAGKVNFGEKTGEAHFAGTFVFLYFPLSGTLL